MAFLSAKITAGVVSPSSLSKSLDDALLLLGAALFLLIVIVGGGGGAVGGRGGLLCIFPGSTVTLVAGLAYKFPLS